MARVGLFIDRSFPRNEDQHGCCALTAAYLNFLCSFSPLKLNTLNCSVHSTQDHTRLDSCTSTFPFLKLSWPTGSSCFAGLESWTYFLLVSTYYGQIITGFQWHPFFFSYIPSLLGFILGFRLGSLLSFFRSSSEVLFSTYHGPTDFQWHSSSTPSSQQNLKHRIIA